MAGKNKGGREARKPKQEQNKKGKGQAAPVGSIAENVKANAARPKK